MAKTKAQPASEPRRKKKRKSIDVPFQTWKQHDLAVEYARRRGLGVSTWIRSLVLEKIEWQYDEDPEYREQED